MPDAAEPRFRSMLSHPWGRPRRADPPSYSVGAPSEHYALRTKLTRTGRWRVQAYHPADADGPDTWSGYENMLVR